MVACILILINTLLYIITQEHQQCTTTLYDGVRLTHVVHTLQVSIVMNTPATTAEPMTPATLGPMACCRR